MEIKVIRFWLVQMPGGEYLLRRRYQRLQKQRSTRPRPSRYGDVVATISCGIIGSAVAFSVDHDVQIINDGEELNRAARAARRLLQKRFKGSTLVPA
ncbi:MAG: hypothetical protein A2669_03160 [Candidatus Yanofskybacteria bacterium RIFCSPHIGHO2_01_FULL_48_25b]|uniref:Uncharacterized protein n=1 Tax=Candidatus Yanofskybacteria bacterium RIFCSPHIGHO2_01_FULL_48_25b TaxID=1802672 RepID=A0A1F8F0G9_9BACT|nr:MAG: hypothetical protein A2669_03160 [Candidatus Yanofskybacteria bacterium RIFCSPHIGHO2_01_FULL_48_25b]